MHYTAGVVSYLSALQDETIVKGGLKGGRMIVPMTHNRILAIFHGSVEGRKSQKRMTDFQSVNIWTFDEDYRISAYQNIYDTATARAIVDGKYSE